MRLRLHPGDTFQSLRPPPAVKLLSIVTSGRVFCARASVKNGGIDGEDALGVFAVIVCASPAPPPPTPLHTHTPSSLSLSVSVEVVVNNNKQTKTKKH